MPSTLAVNPNAFVTEAEATAYAAKGATLLSPDADVIVNGINWATSRMETMTGRALKARNYTLAQTVTADASVSGLAATGASLAILQAARVGDEVVQTSGTNRLVAGTRVASAYAGGFLALTPAASGSVAGAGFAIGSQPLIFDGDNSRELRLDQRPLVTLYGIWWEDEFGVRTALDLTSAAIDYRTATILLRNDFFWRGRMNILVEARVGYTPPAASVIGDWAAWGDLRNLQLRMVEFYRQLYAIGAAATGTTSAGEKSATLLSTPLPPDLQAGIMAYARIV